MVETAFTLFSVSHVGQARGAGKWPPWSARLGTARKWLWRCQDCCSSRQASFSRFLLTFMISLWFGWFFPHTLLPQLPHHLATGKPDLRLQRCQWPAELSGRCLFFGWCQYPRPSSGFRSCALLGPAPGWPPGSAPWTAAPRSWARTSGWMWTPPATGEEGVWLAAGPLRWRVSTDLRSC